LFHKSWLFRTSWLFHVARLFRDSRLFHRSRLFRGLLFSHLELLSLSAIRRLIHTH
jgi:hypothetical protein